MNPNLSLAVGIAALCVSVLTVVTVVWRGGVMVGTINAAASEWRRTIDGLTSEVSALRATRDEHIGLIARVVAQMDSLEQRVDRLEP